MDDATIDALADLRLSDLKRSPGYPGIETSRAFHRARVEAAAAAGSVRAREGLDAAVFWLSDPNPVEGPPLQWLFAPRRSDAALPWVLSTLDAAIDELGDPLVQVPIHDLALLRHLIGRGFGIYGVDLAGPTHLADERLGRPDGWPEELVVLPCGPEHADAVVELRYRVFGAEPEFCWFGAHPAFLEKERAALRQPFEGTRRVILEDGEVRGFVAAPFRRFDAHHGSSISVDVILDRGLRGRGLARHLYRWILDDARREGLGWIKGMTARPQVMRLGLALGRRGTAFTLRRGSWFGEAHFASVLAAMDPVVG